MEELLALERAEKVAARAGEVIPNPAIQAPEWSAEPLCPQSLSDVLSDDPSHSDSVDMASDAARAAGACESETDPSNGGAPSCVNLSSWDMNAFVGHPRMNQAACDTLASYGCGSCGPRGFYGSMDVHVKLERDLADFFGVEKGIVYAYGMNTVCSVIPSYAQPDSIIFVDEGVNVSIRAGLKLSKATVVFFRHNDMTHLEQCLMRADEVEEVL